MTPIAKKIVQWEVPALETLQNSRAYKLRESLNNGGKLSREDKNWITREVRNGTYFNRGIALRGYYFNFSDVLKRYFNNTAIFSSVMPSIKQLCAQLFTAELKLL